LAYWRRCRCGCGSSRCAISNHRRTIAHRRWRYICLSTN
jgi:hypothetical protein